jgi:hypothetical protein
MKRERNRKERKKGRKKKRKWGGKMVKINAK